MKSKESSLIWRSAHCNEMLVIFDIIIYLLYTFISLCTTNKAYCKINSIKEKLIGICNNLCSILFLTFLMTHLIQQKSYSPLM